MTKLRINTTLRGKLEGWVRQQISNNIDATPLEEAKERLHAIATRLVKAAYPAEEMAVLEKYGKARRYCAFDFLLHDGDSVRRELHREVDYPLPDQGYYQFGRDIPADAEYVQAADEVDRLQAAYRAEAARQWEQAQVVINCALYFEDILEYLRVPHADRVNLGERWRLKGYEPKPQEAAVEESVAAPVEPEMNDEEFRETYGEDQPTWEVDSLAA